MYKLETNILRYNSLYTQIQYGVKKLWEARGFQIESFAESGHSSFANSSTLLVENRSQGSCKSIVDFKNFNFRGIKLIYKFLM